ncbi:hypothetical protein N7537_003324 [Penicillium hordei]|uniref:Uncharacterized protein n=1 Tax=Penicillium hordei TaxID=40994 RepID=A0AAD6H522_9EURO|nr:uncharacterized protein N7537_003324 [Penicillium hordei]KAJ5606705.1 hypothetical protein N7537_003324 [Penicillium hordei]
MSTKQPGYELDSESDIHINTSLSGDPFILSDLDMTMPDTLVTPFVIYNLPPHHNAQFIVDSFQRGLDEAVKQLPSLAAKIIFDGCRKPQRRMKPGVLKLTVRQFGPGQHKSYAELAENYFSPSELDHLKLMPGTAYADTTERPLCILQLNFIPGGIILAFGFNHVPLDMASMDLAISLVTKCIQTQMDDSPLEFTPVTFDRKPLAASSKLASLPRAKLLEQTSDYQVCNTAATINQPSSKALENKNCVNKGVVYRISNSNTKRLKQACQPLNGIAKYVSTYDCVVGLLWKSVMRVRATNNTDLNDRLSRLLHPVSLRNRPGSEIPESYFGNALSVASAGPVPIKQLTGPSGLSVAASHIRKSVEGTSQNSIGHVTALSSTMGPSEKMQYQPPGLLEENFLVTSWHSAHAATWDFGLGAPQMVRTWVLPMPGCAVVFPDCNPQPNERVYDCFVILPEAEQDMLSQDVEMNTWFQIQ